MAISVIESELVEASGFEPSRKYNRQDYLAALARVVNDIEETQYDTLSVEAQDWFNAAVRALNKKQDLPEFPDADTEEPSGDPSEDDISDDDETDSENSEVEPEDAEEEPPKKAAKAKGKPVKAAKLKVTPEPKVDVEEAPKSGTKKKKFPQGFDLIQTEHDYGVTPGSLSHQALVMFEQKDGCRMADITQKLGGTYYNLLRKMTKAGHLVEKTGDGFITIRHLNSLDRKAKPVKSKGAK